MFYRETNRGTLLGVIVKPLSLTTLLTEPFAARPMIEPVRRRLRDGCIFIETPDGECEPRLVTALFDEVEGYEVYPYDLVYTALFAEQCPAAVLTVVEFAFADVLGVTGERRAFVKDVKIP